MSRPAAYHGLYQLVVGFYGGRSISDGRARAGKPDLQSTQSCARPHAADVPAAVTVQLGIAWKRGGIDGSTVASRYWHRTGDGRIQCDVCPRACRLHEGQRGFCFVRMRQQDAIVLATYGRSSGYCVDPVEKKPLNHFLPGSAVLSFGTAGCNLGCRFCQNWDISKSREIDTLADEASPEAIARAAAELGCRSVAFTYNDPVDSSWSTRSMWPTRATKRASRRWR